jgi:nucleotide-binding universal stress UspA family protein
MTKLFKKVLCPVAFDDNSIAALIVARDLSEGRDATIFALHVVPPLTILGSPIPLEPYSPTEHDARAKLEEIARENLEGKVKYKILTRAGDPARIAIQVLDEAGADSIVMATHGRKGLGHFFLGSVAELVVRESPCPVLTVSGSTD